MASILLVAALTAGLDRGATAQAEMSAAAAAGELPPVHTTLSAGDRLLQQAAAMLDRRASASARLRHQVALGGRQLYGVGSYWQQGSGADLRVRLELQIAGQNTSLLQISNSRFLWTDCALPTGRAVSRVDLWQLRADPVLKGAETGDIEPGKAAGALMQPELITHCGGLPSLLASLAENFSFLPPQAMRLAAPAPPGSRPATIPVFAVVGHWRPDRLAAILAKGDVAESADSASMQVASVDSIPERLPQEVLLLVGQADLFPYRVEYRRLETARTPSHDATPIPYQLSANPLVVLELSDVAFDAPIAAGQFDYAPPDSNFTDQTAAILDRLRREREQQVASRPDSNKLSPPTR